MRILYVALKHDYGDSSRGLSFEHWNFFDSLHRGGHDILYFDFMSILRERGRDAMNRRLEEVARSERPDVLFTVLFGDQLDRRTVRRISDSGVTRTVNWFCDDHWRFESFSRRWAPCFQWVVTTARSALPKYEAIGYRNVIKSQWACNPFLYAPSSESPLRHDVSFVGQPHGDRREVIAALAREGVRVACWGQGWDAGRISQEAMIEVFRSSRVNLNLSNASTSPPSALERWSAPVRSRIARWIRRPNVAGSGSAPPSRGPAPSTVDREFVLSRAGDQIKGRNFEVPGCGGLLLTAEVDDLGSFYEPGREVVTFRTFGDLVDAVRALLRDEPRRREVAAAGLARTQRDHTWPTRFGDIFGRMGFPTPPTAGPPGIVEEIR